MRLFISPCNDDPTPDNLWEKLKSDILKTSTHLHGYTRMKNRDWHDEGDKGIYDMPTEKRAAHQSHLAQKICLVKKATFRFACSTLQRNPREIHNELLNSLACRTQLCANVRGHRGLNEAVCLTAPIIWESPYSPSLTMHLPESCSTSEYLPSPTKASQRASVASEQTEARQTWCQTSVNSSKNAKNKALNSMLHLSTSQMLWNL